MIQKYRQESEKIQKLKALIRRLHENHHSLDKAKQELAIAQAGYRGEQMIDYYLRFLPSKEYMIFQHVRLQSAPTYYFQMDQVIVAPNVILILEVKNIAGTLYFDDQFKQCIRTDADGLETGFSNPIYQVERQRLQLLDWLKDKKLPDIPVIPLVIIAHPSTIVKSTSPEVANKVVHAATLVTTINNIHKTHKMKKYDQQQLRKLARLFKKEHTELKPHDIKQFGVKENEIISGVQCPQCQTFKMVRHRAMWFCNVCTCRVRDAHIRAIADFRLLFGPEINNKQFREFLHVIPNYEASRMLRELEFPSTGHKKNRVYQIPVDIIK